MINQNYALLGDETDALASASNFVALLYHAIENVNRLGIYVTLIVQQLTVSMRRTRKA